MVSIKRGTDKTPQDKIKNKRGGLGLGLVLGGFFR